MRRKARLKVLYWPALASVCIILILIGAGPLATVLRPALTHFWAGSNLGSLLGRWLPDNMSGTRSITLPWFELASENSRKHSNRPFAKPRTLVIQTDGEGLSGDASSVDVRGNLDRESQPRSFHSPHALRNQAANAFDAVAEAKLLAPSRDSNEELAGLERSAVAVGRLASQPLSNDDETSITNGLDARAYISDDLRNFAKRTTDAIKRGHGIGGGWPATPQLDRDLETVVRVASQKGMTRLVSTSVDPNKPNFSINDWQAQVSHQLAALNQLPSVTSPDAGKILASLQTLAVYGNDTAEQIDDRELQIRLLRVTHGLERRLAIWNAVWRTTQGTVIRVSDVAPDADLAALESRQSSQLIDQVRQDALASDDADGWLQFLMIDELETANQSGDADERRLVAQRLLSRLSWHRLSEEHREWLDRSSLRNLSIQLRRWAAKPLDYAGLLAQIERQESDAIDLGGIDVASAVQTLRFAESREANRIAQSLNTYYRNANMRVAVSSELISRMIPEVEAKVQPVRDQIMGAEVRGTSMVHSDLGLRFLPSDRSWKMVLENQGRINTDATSRQWPVRVRSDSYATFTSSTPLEITPDGAIAGSTGVDVRASTKLRGMQTDFDSIPLVNALVREIAMNRYESMSPVTSRIQKTKIRNGVSGEVDERVAEQLDQASQTLARRLTGPLGSLQLSPLVVDMQSTETRLSARYRVAGDWQLAAFTPRPRAPYSSLMSVQLHQSAINNVLETVLPSGEPKTIGEVASKLKELFGVDESSMEEGDDEMAADALIQFAATRPITVEIEDDILWVTMRVMRLKQDGIDLRRFIVRAGYRPQVDGISAKLVREGHLRISGPDMSMRDRLPVRAIFNKVFSARRALPLVPEKWASHDSLKGLAVTQAELRDGWIAIAIGRDDEPALTPQIARTEDDETSSTGSF